MGAVQACAVGNTDKASQAQAVVNTAVALAVPATVQSPHMVAQAQACPGSARHSRSIWSCAESRQLQAYSVGGCGCKHTINQGSVSVRIMAQ
jgi:hypothetical protein